MATWALDNRETGRVAMKPSMKCQPCIATGLEASGLTKGLHPPWYAPAKTDEKRVTGLRVRNTLTGEKELFVPREGNRVMWYTCGPTVYDKCHMGHARAYLTMDIMRRILEDYFQYEVFLQARGPLRGYLAHATERERTFAFGARRHDAGARASSRPCASSRHARALQVNVTDIDDKIIKRARQNKLIADYVSEARPAATVYADVRAAATQLGEKMALKLAELETPKADKREEDERGELLEQHKQKIAKFDETKATIERLIGCGASSSSELETLVQAASEPLAEALDAEKGAAVTQQEIFNAHARRYARRGVALCP